MRDVNLLKTKQFYDFADFRLDPSEKTLLHHGAPVSLPPKVFDTLHLFVQNPNRLLEKELIISAIWENQFVEESNLTYTVKMLRKALGDDAGHPSFIETVPRRGYRFIATVKEVFPQEPIHSSADNDISAFAPPFIILEPQVSKAEALPKTEVFKNKKSRILLPLLILLILGVAVIAGAVLLRKKEQPKILTTSLISELLSTNGQVNNAIISLDGKNLFYTNTFNNKKSIWVRQIESANNTQIIPQSEDSFFGLALSPDNQYLYFTKGLPSSHDQLGIYRIPVFGGVPPQKIADNTQGWISLSPDGTKISFVRCFHRDDESCSLWIADAADGKNERKLATRRMPFRIGDNKFSPDGKMIAFTAGESETNANDFGLFIVDVASGVESEIKTQKFFDIRSIVWLPNQKDLLIAARRNNDRNFGIWQVSTNSNEVHLLTNDSESYLTLSTDQPATKIISTQVKRDFHLVLYSVQNPAEKRVLSDAITVSFADDQKIVFSSAMMGEHPQIWSSNADGTDQRQLTDGKNDSRYPIFSPDKNSVFFTSNQTGDDQIWRMNADGSNLTQLTKKEGGFPLNVSPDGKWLYYHSTLGKTLWRVSTEGNGGEALILNERKGALAISPDCSKAAFFQRQGKELNIVIVSLANNRLLQTFKPVEADANPDDLVWSANGEKLFYTLTAKQEDTLWIQPLANNQPPQKIINFGDEQESHFALSPNGTEIAVIQGNWRKDAVLLKEVKTQIP